MVVAVLLVTLAALQLRGWAEANQARVLSDFANEVKDAKEFVRLPTELDETYRQLAKRSQNQPLSFLEFGIVVSEHRRHLDDDGNLDAVEIDLLDAMVAALLADEFDPVTYAVVVETAEGPAPAPSSTEPTDQ